MSRRIVSLSLTLIVGVVATAAAVLLDGWAGESFPRVAGVLPAVVFLLPLAAGLLWLRRGTVVTRGELAQATFVYLFVGVCVLTAVGIWFRGPGMVLIWPWSVSF